MLELERSRVNDGAEPSTAQIPVGSVVRYVGVVNEELDLEREGIVRAGPDSSGDLLVKWYALDIYHRRWETPGALEVVRLATDDPTATQTA